jgi:hypothetical protein
MSTSRRYDTITARLTQLLPAVRPRLLDPLVCALVGISQSVSAHQGRIAACMPLATKQHSKIQRLRRLLDNPKLSDTSIYHPVLQHALQGLQRQRVNLLLDRVILSPHLNLLVVSLGFRRRSLPLVWRLLSHSGSSTLDDQQAVLTAAAALLPESVRIIVHADSEFRSFALFSWLRHNHWHALLGIRATLLVSSDPAQAGKPLADWLPDRESVAYLTEVWIREDRAGPVNLLAWWDQNDRCELIVYGVMTSLPATWQTFVIGKRRMWIETLFRDWQRGGFELGTSALRDHARFSRLLVLICLVYIWFVSVGRWLVKRGYRTRIDAGPSSAWQLSLFSLAIAWQNRLRSFNQQMPVFWLIYF